MFLFETGRRQSIPVQKLLCRIRETIPSKSPVPQSLCLYQRLVPHPNSSIMRIPISHMDIRVSLIHCTPFIHCAHQEFSEHSSITDEESKYSLEIPATLEMTKSSMSLLLFQIYQGTRQIFYAIFSFLSLKNDSQQCYISWVSLIIH